MNRTLMIAMATTALTFPAFAQDGSQVDPKNQECADLAIYVQDNDPTDSGISRKQALMIVQRDDAQTCRDAMRVARGEIATDEQAENFDADATARLRVSVPEPDVTVKEAAPVVDVTQAQPTVKVNPGRPIVTVRQAEPVVNVEVPQPRITIDMPKPSITVEMPDPTVEVAMAQPRVTVTQPKPDVRVEQGDIKVEIGDSRAIQGPQDEEPNVTIEQDNAKVQVQKPEDAEVNIADVKPDVRYEAAEARITVEQSGEPEIQFNQSGEADVQFRQLTEEETRAAADEISQQLAARDNGVKKQAEGKDQARDQRVAVGDIVDKSVVDAQGEALGNIQSVIILNDEHYMIIASAPALGTDERQVGLPISDAVLNDNGVLMRNITGDDVKQATSIDPEKYPNLNRSDPINVERQ